MTESRGRERASDAKGFMAAASCALVCLASLVARAASAGLVVGPVVEAPFLEDHFWASAAILENGSFVLGGTRVVEEPPNNPQAVFELQTYSPAGGVNGPIVTPEPSFGAGFGSVGSTGRRYFVRWQNSLEAVTHAANASPSGALGSARPFPNSEIQNFGQYSRFGSAPTWRFLPVIYKQSSSLPVATLQAFERDGRPAGRVARLGQDGRSTFLNDAAINGQGRFVAITDQCATQAPASCQRGLQVFDASGSPLTGLLSKGLPLKSDGQFNGVAVAGIDGIGEMLVGWSEGLLAQTQSFVIQRFDERGAPRGSVVTVARAAKPEGIARAQIAAVGDGHFVLSWTLVHADQSSTIYVAEYSIRRGIAPARAVWSGFVSDYGVEVAWNGTGEGIVAWASTTDASRSLPFSGHVAFVRTFARKEE